MSKGNTNSKEDFWEEASKLIPDSNQITTLFYELELIWSNAIDIKEQAESMGLREVLRNAREIERLAFRWMELSRTLQPLERLRLRGALAACWGHLCNLCYAQCYAFHHQPKCVTSLHGCPILAVCKTALGLPLNERYLDGETHDEFRQRLCPSQKCALCGGVEDCKLWRVFGDCEGVWDAFSGRLYDYIRKEAIGK